MKMRFWQKTYILTLVLFLLCINIGILSLTVYTHNRNVDAEESASSAEQYYIVSSFERDYEDLHGESSYMANASLLMNSYGSYYAKKGVYLAFFQNGRTWYDNFPEELIVAEDTVMHRKLDGKRHIIISSSVCGGEFVMRFGKDISYLDKEYRALMFIYILTALGVSLLLAVGLYFILKKLSSPLEKLRKTTETIESGDYTVTAEEIGSDEFTLLAKSFNSMLAKINEQMSALELDAEKKQMLVDNMAHELRTPLTSIHGYAEYLEKAATTQEKRLVAVKYIISESERLQKISELLLDSAYVRGGEIEMSELDLSKTLFEVVGSLSLKAEGADVKLIHDGCDIRVYGNETMLSMLFYNLVENAIKASPSGAQVKIFSQGTAVVVEDNGKGMTEEQLKHITEPFYRTDKARSRKDGGAGLGLALCKQIVQTHGASLRFESAIGKGTKAIVNFTDSKL